MKNIIVISLLSFYTMTTFGQEMISKEFAISRTESFDFSNIYYKQTGKKIEKNEFIKLIQKNPNLPLEKVIGVYGEVTRYLVDLTLSNNALNPSGGKRVEKGELFPNFIMNTIENKKIELDKLKGKIVILRFELEADSFRFNKKEIIDLDSEINQINDKKNKVEAIIIFSSSTSEVMQGYDLKNSNFEVVADAFNFREKYSITSFPTTLIIDKNGFLLDYYNRSEDIDLKLLISE
jgi:peroxiredoxin